MKKYLLLLGFLVSFAGLQAQSATVTPTDEIKQRAHVQATRMQKVCGLTTEQFTQVETILTAKFNEMAAVDADKTKSDGEKQAEKEKIKEAKEKEIQAVLTPEQYEKYKSIREERKKSREAGNRGNK